MTVESGESTSSGGQASSGHLDARWPEVVMAAFLFVVAVLVIVDSIRVGTGWADDGPRSGYFPFYIGCILLASSGWVLFGALTVAIRWLMVAYLVIQALGFEPEDLTGQWDAPDLAVTRWGTVKADFRSHATNLPGVYAAGDIVRGASLVVWAIRDGREAADAILEYLAQPAQVAAE